MRKVFAWLLEQLLNFLCNEVFERMLDYVFTLF